jgi:outer membrane protein assembly factor BamB
VRQVAIAGTDRWCRRRRRARGRWTLARRRTLAGRRALAGLGRDHPAGRAVEADGQGGHREQDSGRGRLGGHEHRRERISKMIKWLRRLGLALVAVALLVLALRAVFGLRVYIDGDFRPHLAFGKQSARYDALEAQRAAQKTAPTPPSPAADVAADANAAARIAAPVPAAASAPASTQAAAPLASPVPAAVPATAPTPAPATAPPTAAPPSGGGSWTDYRGPARDGVYRQGPIAATWPAGGPRLLWKQPIGEGHASFVVARGVAYTIEQRRNREVVAAYDLRTGHERWTVSWDALFSEAMGGDGPRATPTYADGMLYALGAAGELRALRADSGAVVWRTNILVDAGAQNLQWGMSAAPLVVDGKVIVQPGGRGASIVAYDAATGKAVWKTLDDQQAYVSPMVATLAGRRQIVTITGTRAVGLSIADGALLWSYPWATDMAINIAQPLVFGPSKLFLSSGYGKGAAAIDIAPDGDRFRAARLWEHTRMKNKLSSSVLLGGFVYGLDEGILSCVEAETGRVAWKGGRYGHGQLLLAGDRLLITTETGELALVHATPDRHVELARVPGIEGRTWNVPALADGILLVRNAEEMAAFDVR